MQKRYRRRNVRIIGVSLDDDPSAVRSFSREFKMNYPVVIGDAALAERYGGILGLPVVFLIDCEGRIRVRHDGEANTTALERDVNAMLDTCGRK